MVTTLETASSSPFQTSFFAFAVFIYEQNNCFILLLFSIYICLLSRGPGMRVISACLGISLAQWSGFLFSPFSFHVLLLELCRKCPPGRAPGPPFLYPWCCSWSNVGMHWARWYSQTVAITALLSVCPGGQFPVNRFGVAWTQSAGRLCHLPLQVSKKPWLGIPHCVVILTLESFNSADYKCGRQSTSGSIAECRASLGCMPFAFRKIRLFLPGYYLLLWRHA